MDNLHLHGKRCLEQKNAGKKSCSKVKSMLISVYSFISKANTNGNKKEAEKWVNWQ